jgi:hypothetical protein
MKKIQPIPKTLSALLLASLGIFACGEKENPLSGEFKGDETTFGFGKAYTYIINDGDGNPSEIGVAIDADAFDNFTELSGDAEVSLNYPAEASQTPFKHQFMGFAAHGHEPVGIYDVPHYDLHFYTSTIAERSAISPYDTVKAANMPGPDFFPAAYVPTGLVPNMGVHWLDVTSPELNGSAFTQTFIWGSFDGKVTFLEPMVTRQFIMASHDFETDIKQPAQYDQPGKYYPTKQGFEHNHDKGEYRFFLKGFVQR